ncbi:flagellar rod assembly protein/muramidase FlgJ [Salmonella enterica subsp. enterica serovar Typhimurium]|nr:flagellar rod assembly protein/muramidase FlgJ [Salmonella enterica subsp. enterica serovar Typhimurium]
MIGDGKLLASAAWDAQSLNELKAKAGQDPAANIRPVARQVEGMFVQMMLKSMREALPKDGLFSSDQTRLYTSMYDQQIAQQMTAGKGLGLADMMVKQMTSGQTMPADDAPQVPLKFSLETVNSYSYNVFGVKATASWKGPVTEITTTEYENGEAKKVKAKFRVYSSYLEALSDYVALLTRNPRYAAVTTAATAEQGAVALQNAGYATDPNYARKLTSMIQQLKAMSEKVSKTYSANLDNLF